MFFIVFFACLLANIVAYFILDMYQIHLKPILLRKISSKIFNKYGLFNVSPVSNNIKKKRKKVYVDLEDDSYKEIYEWFYL